MIPIDPISSTGQCGIDELVVLGWKQFTHLILTQPAGSRNRGDAAERSVILSFFDCRISCFVLAILVVAFIMRNFLGSCSFFLKMRHMHRMYPRYDIWYEYVFCVFFDRNECCTSNQMIDDPSSLIHKRNPKSSMTL